MPSFPRPEKRNWIVKTKPDSADGSKHAVLHFDLLDPVYGDDRTFGYILGYGEAVDLLMAKMPEKQDHLIYPLAYLFRHEIELRLKDLARQVNRACSASIKVDGHLHDLAKLWEEIAPHFKKICPQEKNTFSTISAILNEIQTVDSRADSFKYGTHRATKPKLERKTLEGIYSIKFKELYTEWRSLCDWLECAVAYTIDRIGAPPN